jgi:uridine kinase
MTRKRKLRPVLVAIGGGSGSGKTWLTQRLEQALAPHAIRLCLDDFYRDRSHLTLPQRSRLNFDHPRAIDWTRLEQVLRGLLAGRKVRVPCYDFTVHSRSNHEKTLTPKPIILLEGLWLLRRPVLRRLFSFSIFLDRPARIRLQRRLARDLVSRGRIRLSIQRQFRQSVQPMHVRYVAPQARFADLVLRDDCTPADLRLILRACREQAVLR